MTSAIFGAIPPLIAVGVVSGVAKQIPKMGKKKKKKCKGRK